MKILSHRGYWKEVAEKNTVAAFQRSFHLGFGTETDLRDHCGQVVISHDPALGAELSFEEFLAIYCAENLQLPLALNIKADGLQPAIQEAIAKMPDFDFFCFDMSVPDALQFAKWELPFFTRQSEIEPEVVLYRECCGVWMDMFFSDWIEEEDVLRHLDCGKRVCLVSPDLHKRPHEKFWEHIASWACVSSQELLMCTDYPEDARLFFHFTYS